MLGHREGAGRAGAGRPGVTAVEANPVAQTATVTVDPTLTIEQATYLGQAVKTAMLNAVEQARGIRWTLSPGSQPGPIPPSQLKRH